MRSIIVLLCLFTLISGMVTAENITNTSVSSSNQSSAVITGNFSGVAAVNTTASDQQFLFLMNQYWIPDLYDIKGRIDGAASFGSDVPQMLNLSSDYARIRLDRNVNETNGYTISPAVSVVRTQYQTTALRSIKTIDQILALNRTESTFAQNVSSRTAALSLYGTWLEYQVMNCYKSQNISYPDIAMVPPDKFMQVMGVIS